MIRSRARLFSTVVGGVLAAWALSCHYNFAEALTCSSCAASGYRSQWFVGFRPLGYAVLDDGSIPRAPGSIPITPAKLAVGPSIATQRLFPSTHHHDWCLVGANPLYLFGTRWGGCVLGAGFTPSPFAAAYLHDQGFRSFVDRLIAERRYDRATIAAMFAASDRHPTSQAYQGAEALLRAFSAASPHS